MHRWRVRWFSALFAISALLMGCAHHDAMRSAEAGWYVARTPRFEVLTDSDPEKAKALAEDLERFHQVLILRTTAEERPGAPPLRVFMTGDRSDYRALGGHKRTAGMFKATTHGNIAIVDLEQSQAREALGVTSRQILFHEYVHYVQALSGAPIPSWYAEGMAEYLATIEFQPNGSYTMGKPPPRAHIFKFARWLPLRRVLDADNLMLLGGDSSDPYAQAWLVMHSCMTREGRSAQLGEYLELWSKGVSSEQAVEQAFGIEFEAFERDVRVYADKPQWTYMAVEPAKSLEQVAATLQPVSKGTAHRLLGTMLLDTMGPSPKVLELLREGVRLQPKDALAHVALGRAHWRAALQAARDSDDPKPHLRQAEDALERAALLSPKHPELLNVRGHLLSLRADLAVTDQRMDDAHEALNQARRAYRLAIRGDQGLAEAYYGLGATYLRHDNGSKEAVVVLQEAQYLLPLAPRVAMSLAQLLIAREEYKQALAPLRYLRAFRRDPETQAEVERTLEKLRRAARATDSK